MKYTDDYRGDLLRIKATLEEEHNQIMEMIKLNTSHEMRWHIRNRMEKLNGLYEAYERIERRDLDAEIRSRFAIADAKEEK